MSNAYFRNIPVSKEIANNTRKIKNKILAMPAALEAIPPKPNTAAIIATIKNMSAQRNITKTLR